ncbi:hypothetical protein Cci01nite_35670 [Catellatospora citrea]|uniref:Flavoprotein domain-containing protein n=1 Tax=Catellatospora citrea TaxID=53366 RepID=A0A8J3NZL3_9ACTN|nr:hypothetical protein Cci01nite_35670 [Catellatospora citrea]
MPILDREPAANGDLVRAREADEEMKRHKVLSAGAATVVPRRPSDPAGESRAGGRAPSTRNAHVVVCAAPPAAAVSDLVELLMAAGWTVQVVPTAAAVDWLDLPRLEALTGNPIVSRARKPGESRRESRPDLVIVAPASFNTINKWVAGINDNVALSLLNTTFGLQVPTIVSPYAKAVLAAHPGFRRNLALLAQWGALVTERDALRPQLPAHPYHWNVIMDLIPAGLR